MSESMETLDKFRCAIVVTKITPPGGRGRSYRIDTREGNTLWMWPDKVHLLRINEEYDVEGTVRDSYYNITKVRHLGPAPEDEQPAPTPTAPITSNNRGKTKMDYYRPRDPEERREIFVCALLGREIEWRGGRPAMTKQELLERGSIYADVWNQLFAASNTEKKYDHQAQHDVTAGK